MPPEVDQIHNIMQELHREILSINTTDPPGNDDTRRETILRNWEMLTAHLGLYHLVLEAGFDMSPELLDLPTSEAGTEGRGLLEDALRRMLKAADGINEHREGVGIRKHNQNMRELLIDSWEQVAHATGRRAALVEPLVQASRDTPE